MAKIELRKQKAASSSSKSSGSSSSSPKKVTKSYTTTSGEKVIKYSDGTESRTGGSSSTPKTSNSTTPKTNDELIADLQRQADAIQKAKDEGVASGQIKTQAQVDAEKAGIVTPESIAEAVAGATPENAEGYVPDEVTDDTFVEGEGTYQTQPDGSAVLVGGSGPQNLSTPRGGQTSTATPLSNPSVVDYLNATGQASDFGSRKRLAESLGINGYTGSAQQNGQLLASLRGAPMTVQETVSPVSAGGVAQYQESKPTAEGNALTYQTLASKFGLTGNPNTFNADPIASIKTLTKEVFSAMGLGEANKEIENISEELEDLENERDNELREADDDPWSTEGVRLRNRAKIEKKYEDKINNRVNRLQLMESVRDDAQQSAQFALGTAISLWDTQQRLQAQQVQMFYDQAQREFENQFRLDNELRRREEFGADLNIKLANLAFEEQRLGFDQQRIGLESQRVGLEGARLGLQQQELALKQTEIFSELSKKTEKEQKAITSQAQKAQVVFRKINEAKDQINLTSTGFVGGLSQLIPGTPAKNLASTVDTIKANIGFDTLQSMREASPTGGALGQVAVQELAMLQSTISSLDVGQSPDQLAKNLDNVFFHYQNWLETVGYSVTPSGEVVKIVQ